MNNRSTQRKHFHMGVTIYQDGRPIVCTDSIDLSTEGIAISSGPSFDVNTPLEIEFLVDRHSRQERIKLPALVTHSSTEGTGLNFCQTDERAKELIIELLSD
jgi:hypothetical protein